MNLLQTYKNGNADVCVYTDGTRIIECIGDIKLQYPLNIDIRVSQKCAFGRNPKTGKAVCGFCHESATTDGEDADLDKLFNKLVGLPAGIELAVGVNGFTDALETFLERCKASGWIVNVTINQGHLRRDREKIHAQISTGNIKGLGISYRRGMQDIPQELLDHPNMVVHVISGIDSIEDIKELAGKGVKKILVLGEKDFGFNLGCVKITNGVHREWYRKVHELFKLFDVVSFDNLALEQLNVKRFVKNWEEIYQYEYSFYINAVEQYFSPSSRSVDVTHFDEITPEQYFKQLFPEFN